MDIHDFVKRTNLEAAAYNDKILLFGWWLHKFVNQEHFDGKQIAKCFENAHLSQPANMSVYLGRLTNGRNARLLKSRDGYRLARKTREQYEAEFGRRPSTVQTHKLLESLDDELPNEADRAFLNEALLRLQVGAHRAAIVMCWNLAFDNLCEWILANHLPAFNAQLPRTVPKARRARIKEREHFSELKESEVVQICKSAGIVSNDVGKILKQKLDTRNTAAHPSKIVFTPVQAEEFITNIVKNVIKRMV